MLEQEEIDIASIATPIYFLMRERTVNQNPMATLN